MEAFPGYNTTIAGFTRLRRRRTYRLSAIRDRQLHTMRVTASSAFFALLPSLIHAVSLSDMTPRAEDLPPDCDDIYTSQISGCGISDFTTQTCTDGCIEALNAMVGPIKEACGGKGVTGQNLVVAFLANVGPQQICPNADAGGYGEESSSAPAPESTTSPSPSPSPSSTPTPSPTSTTEASVTEASSSVQSTSLLVDTSSAVSSTSRTRTPAFSGTTTATSLSEEQSSTATSREDGSSRTTTTTSGAAGATSTGSSDQTSQEAANDGSGGGSPFDSEGNMFSGADSLSSTSVLVSLGIAVVVVAFLFR